MTGFLNPNRRLIALIVLAAFFGRVVVPASAKSPVKLQAWEGTIDLAIGENIPFSLNGFATHLGKFTAEGEVLFVPGEEEGTLIGEGVVVFKAANGDLLVGVVEWEAAAEVDDLRTSAIHFSWRDSVTFSDGEVVSSTGRFTDDRPPGLVVIAIIAIILPLLLPAVQKTK